MESKNTITLLISFVPVVFLCGLTASEESFYVEKNDDGFDDGDSSNSTGHYQRNRIFRRALTTCEGEIGKMMLISCPGNRYWGCSKSWCDEKTDGGTWLVIQRRAKGDEDFNRCWTDYADGFGTVETDFWVGLKTLHSLTHMGFNELRIGMQLNGRWYYAQYSYFKVSDERQKFKLSIRGYKGNAGDGLKWHDNKKFSTYDEDNDEAKNKHCAETNSGGWWFNSCYQGYLNGVWRRDAEGGIIWGPLARKKSLTYVEMKIRNNLNIS